jgi:putative transcriptional regulator
LYSDSYTRLDVTAINQLCQLFKCQVNDLFEYVPDPEMPTP